MSDDVLDVAEWIQYAQSDYSLAVEISDKPNPYYARHVCYHCQQAAEKILKAYLIVKNVAFPKTHDLDELAQICEKYSPDFCSLFVGCARLDMHIVTTRYLSHKKLTLADVGNALKDTAQVLDFTTAKLKEAGY